MEHWVRTINDGSVYKTSNRYFEKRLQFCIFECEKKFTFHAIPAAGIFYCHLSSDLGQSISAIRSFSRCFTEIWSRNICRTTQTTNVNFDLFLPRHIGGP